MRCLRWSLLDNLSEHVLNHVAQVGQILMRNHDFKSDIRAIVEDFF